MDEGLRNRALKLIQRDPSLHGWKTQDKTEIIALGNAILGKSPCRGCPGEMDEIFLELRALVTNQYKTKVKMSNENQCQFSIGENQVLQVMQTGDIITSKNISDEICFKCLAKNPKLINQFKKFPTDWEKQVKAWAEKKEAAAKKEAAEKTKKAEDPEGKEDPSAGVPKRGRKPKAEGEDGGTVPPAPEAEEVK